VGQVTILGGSLPAVDELISSAKVILWSGLADVRGVISAQNANGQRDNLSDDITHPDITANDPYTKAAINAPSFLDLTDNSVVKLSDVATTPTRSRISLR